MAALNLSWLPDDADALEQFAEDQWPPESPADRWPPPEPADDWDAAAETLEDAPECNAADLE